MKSITVESQASFPPQAYHHAQACGKDALHIYALAWFVPCTC